MVLELRVRGVHYRRILRLAAMQSFGSRWRTKWNPMGGSGPSGSSGIPNNWLVFDGDSLTAGSGSSTGIDGDGTVGGAASVMSYPGQLQTLLGAGWTRTNFAVGGSTVMNSVNGVAYDLIEDGYKTVDLAFDTTKVINFCLVWIGSNDLAHGSDDATATTTYDRVSAYCKAKQLMGFRVITFTVLPRDATTIVGGDEAAFNVQRALFNTSVRSGYTSWADGLVDVAADSRIGDDGDDLDTTYYDADKVHLNDTGYAIVAGLAKTVVQALTTAATSVSSSRRGLANFWKLNEASGTRADSSVATGSPALRAMTMTDDSAVGSSATGAPDGTRCGHFVLASTDSLSHADSNILGTGDIDFEVEVWVNLATKTEAHYYIVKMNATYVDNSDIDWGVSFSQVDDRFQFTVGNNTTSGNVFANALGSPSTGTWYCIQAYHDHTNDLIGISVNGGAFTTAAYTGGGQNSDGKLDIGAVDISGTPLLHSNADIWHAAFWARLRTSAERTASYNGGTGTDFGL